MVVYSDGYFTDDIKLKIEIIERDIWHAVSHNISNVLKMLFWIEACRYGIFFKAKQFRTLEDAF